MPFREIVSSAQRNRLVMLKAGVQQAMGEGEASQAFYENQKKDPDCPDCILI